MDKKDVFENVLQSGDFRKRRSTILVWTTKISSDVSTYYAQPLTHAYKTAKYSKKKKPGSANISSLSSVKTV